MNEDDRVWDTLHFIDEPIEVTFHKSPLFSKKPHAPDLFTWNDKSFVVRTLVSSWTDFSRRGRMARNMRPQNIRKTVSRGSWGVGRFYFRVEVEDGQYFDLYYDRAPHAAGEGEGEWILLRQVAPAHD